MNIITKTSPYVRKQASTKRMMIDVLIALIPVVLFAVYRFKLDAVIRILISAIVMVGLEVLFFCLSKQGEGTWLKRFKDRFNQLTINNITAPLVSAIIFSMLLPSKVNLFAVVIGAAFGIVVGKMIYGGLGANLFNPAATGRIFLLVALSGLLTGSYEGIISGATPLGFDKLDPTQALAHYSLSDLFFGNIPGAMGEINKFLILIGLGYLLIRRSADFRVVLSAVITFVVLMLFAALRIAPDNIMNYILFHVLSGGLLFGVAFMITDPVTSPVTRPGRWLYGMVIAIIIVLTRLLGSYPEGTALALLFGNAIVPLIDYPKWASNKYKISYVVGLVVLLAVFSVVVYLGVGGIS